MTDSTTSHSNGNGRTTLRAPEGAAAQRREGFTMPASAPLPSQSLPNIALARLFQRVNRDGRTYYVGRLGSARVLLVPTGTMSRGEPEWQLILGEGFYGEKNTGAAMARGFED